MQGLSDVEVYAKLREVHGLPVTLRQALFEFGRKAAAGDGDVLGLQVDLMVWASGQTSDRLAARPPPRDIHDRAQPTHLTFCTVFWSSSGPKDSRDSWFS